MIDAVGNPQSLLLLGGTSEIALATAERYAAQRPLRVVLAARPSDRRDAAADRLRDKGCTVSTLPFDAADTASHAETIEKAFTDGDIDALRPSGIKVSVIRPGFVHTRMTAGMKVAPLSVTPEQVADVIVDSVAKEREQAWAPAQMRLMMSVLRHVPRPIFRRLPV
ncbi:MAG: KR domain-containing protein [Pseudonocardiaceae bacterium]